MKKLIATGLVIAALTVSSVVVFAAESRISTDVNSIDSLISRVIGSVDEEIAQLRANGIGYGRLIPASILAEKLKISLSEAAALKETGSTYSQVAVVKGISLDDFRKELIEKRKKLIDERVKEGYISEQQGELMKERIENNISNCDGTGNGGNCRGSGLGMMFGTRGNGCGLGQSKGFGRGKGLQK